jgi:hypothetical protein
MKSDLAIAALIRSRLTELGLSRGEFAKRLGYKNIARLINQSPRQAVHRRSFWSARLM